MPQVKMGYQFDSKAALKHFRYMAETRDKRFPSILRTIGVTGLNHQRLSIRSGQNPETGMEHRPKSIRARLEGGKTLFNTGMHLANRFRSRVMALGVEIWNDWEYAHVHHLGMTIKAKNPSGYMTFPIKAATAGARGGRVRRRVQGWVRVASVHIPQRTVIGLTTAVKKLLTLQALRGYFPGGSK